LSRGGKTIKNHDWTALYGRRPCVSNGQDIDRGASSGCNPPRRLGFSGAAAFDKILGDSWEKL